MNGVERHAGCCPKRAWECQYCGLKCTYGEGEGEHWPMCTMFPEPCPNGCEVGSVERCNVEQHRSVCSLEPVCCEMREFGCSAVVLRKDLVTHMRESELQHLTSMAVLNLRLTRQLQQDLAEKGKKIALLQQEMSEQRQLHAELKKGMAEQQTEMKNEVKKEFSEQKNMQAEMKKELSEQNQETKEELTELRGQIQLVHNTTQHIEVHSAGLCGLSGLCKVFTFDQYSQHKGKVDSVYSDPFYSHQHGYKFRLTILYTDSSSGCMWPHLELLTGEYDDQLPWPVNVKAHLELLNQVGDHHHVERTKTWNWKKDERGKWNIFDYDFIEYSAVEKKGGGVQYMMNDCSKFRLHLTAQAT